ncbi:stage III sporulation protein AA [Bacillota bacterium Meth-B3]|nr:stage III sporulation protein AA [Christensenellaceae bacterium]
MRSLIERLPDELMWIGEIDLSEVREVRVRLGQQVELRGTRGSRLMGDPVPAAVLRALVHALTAHSLYACEVQMREGFFSLPGGLRVGLTGRYASGEDAPIQQVTSVCIRLSRAVDGAVKTVLPFLMDGARPLSALILSAPCMGKTTLLRALIRALSEAGCAVAVADERDELGGAPTLGPRADVAALVPKRIAIMRMLRALSPDVVATDELGHSGDAEAVEEAARCGSAVLATAHARSFESAVRRPSLERLLRAGVFERYVELDGSPGHVVRILDGEGGTLWTDGR